MEFEFLSAAHKKRLARSHQAIARSQRLVAGSKENIQRSKEAKERSQAVIEEIDERKSTSGASGE